MNEELCECEICKYDYDFYFPQELIKIAHQGNLVIFAGAGISTEVKEVYPESIYSSIKGKLSLENEDKSFPTLMQLYQDRFGRKELVKYIIEKFDYIDSFKPLRESATRFHRELATMPYINTVITTNWDLYFERYAGFRPFITPEDMVFWNDHPGRKLLKIHGSINNLGTLVATQQDYEKTISTSSLIFNKMQEILANKTIVFIGYSLSDWNFRKLYNEILKSIPNFTPQAYMVSPFPNPSSEEFKLKFINTSGQNFLMKLKHSLIGNCFADDSIYEKVESIYKNTSDADIRLFDDNEIFSITKYPEVIFQWFFNDGMIHACDRILNLQVSGIYSDRGHIKKLVESYDSIIQQSIKKEDYAATAYYSGYENVLFSLLDYDGDWNRANLAEIAKDEKSTIEQVLDSISTRYYFASHDYQFFNLDDYLEFIKTENSELSHYRDKAKKIIKNSNLGSGMVLNYKPFLPNYTQ